MLGLDELSRRESENMPKALLKFGAFLWPMMA